MIFKNIIGKTLKCYGYTFNADGSGVDVSEPDLIRKFSLYWQLDSGESVEPPKVQGEVSRETLKSQAIAAGLKVDGRWSATRLRQEMDNYMRGVNETD